MRTAKLAFVIVLLMLALPLCGPDLDAQEKAETPDPEPPLPPEPVETTIAGYVGDVSNLEKNIPLKNVKVKLLDVHKQILGTVMTDGTGYFEFTYLDGAGKYLTFELEGYTVRTQPSSLFKVEGEVSTLTFTHEDVIDKVTPDPDGKYVITSDLDGGSFVGMGVTTALVTGYVQNEDGAFIEGAKVKLGALDGRDIIGYTDSDGYFEIECFFGTYTMVVSCNGFNESDTMTISTDNKSVDVILEEKTHSIVFGLDTPHTWEFLSILSMALSVLVFAGIHHMIKKGKSEIVMINDLELEPEEEDKD